MAYNNSRIIIRDFDTDLLAEECLKEKCGIKTDDEVLTLQYDIFRSFLDGVAESCGERARNFIDQAMGEAHLRQQHVALPRRDPTRG